MDTVDLAELTDELCGKMKPVWEMDVIKSCHAGAREARLSHSGYSQNRASHTRLKHNPKGNHTSH